MTGCAVMAGPRTGALSWPSQGAQSIIEEACECRLIQRGSTGQCAHHQDPPRGQQVQPFAQEMAQPTAQAVSPYGVPDLAGDHETHARRLPPQSRPIGRDTVRWSIEMQDERPASHPPSTAQCTGELLTMPQPCGGGQHDGELRRELATTLGPAGGKNGATGPGAHAQAESMSLRPTAVVGLERALAHEKTPGTGGRHRCPRQKRRQAGRPPYDTDADLGGQTRCARHADNQDRSVDNPLSRLP